MTIRAYCESVSTRIVRRGIRLTTATLADDSGKVKAIWFNQPYRETQLKSNGEFLFSGEFGLNRNQYQITNPSVERAKDIGDSSGKMASPQNSIIPVYRAIKGVRPKMVQNLFKNLRPMMEFLPETLPEEIIKRQKLVSRSQAIKMLHAPQIHDDIKRGRERLAFEELFEMMLATAYNKHEQTKLKGWQIPFDQSTVKKFVKQLPFQLKIGRAHV